MPHHTATPNPTNNQPTMTPADIAAHKAASHVRTTTTGLTPAGHAALLRIETALTRQTR